MLYSTAENQRKEPKRLLTCAVGYIRRQGKVSKSPHAPSLLDWCLFLRTAPDPFCPLADIKGKSKINSSRCRGPDAHHFSKQRRI